MKKSSLVMISYGLEIFSMASVINNHYLVSIASALIALLICAFILMISKTKVIVAHNFPAFVITLFLAISLKSISTLSISALFTIYCLLFTHTINQLSQKQMNYYYTMIVPFVIVLLSSMMIVNTFLFNVSEYYGLVLMLLIPFVNMKLVNKFDLLPAFKAITVLTMNK